MRALPTLCLLLSGAALACDKAAEDSSRIAIAGGSLTEIVYLLGAGDRLIAVDRTSNHPADALELPSVGYVRNLSAEGLLSLKPSLVLGEHDMGPPEILDQLALTGVEVIRVPEAHDAQGIVGKVRCVARILGLQAEGEKLIDSRLSASVAAIEDIASRAGTDRPRVGVLLGIRDGQPLAAGSDTSGHGLIEMAGGENVFAGMSGWKPGSMESMVQFDPDVLVIPERGVAEAGGIDGIVSHPALRLTTAGRERRIITMDGMTMLGFGPRTLEAAIELARQLDTLPETGG